MLALIAFAVPAAATFVVLVIVAGYGQHLGNPEPVSWPAVVGASVAVGLVVAGLVLVIASLWGAVT